MSTVLSMHVATLRVSKTDATNIATSFKGRVAAFDKMPYRGTPTGSSTGDTIVQPLESPDSPVATLGTGIHLHWELPDYFRKGTQDPDSGEIIFPHTPNRWLVVRYVSIYDVRKEVWRPPTAHTWVVESDYLSLSPLRDSYGVIRPSIPVPFPEHPTYGEQPYRFMGRVVEGAEWPSSAGSGSYLTAPGYLTSIGFLGPSFASYYPDCCSVFGFWDHFADHAEIYTAINQSDPSQFKVSYQVIGWIEGEGSVPTLCNGLVKEVLWDLTSHAGVYGFQGNPLFPSSPARWEERGVRVAIGNSSVESLAALLRKDTDTHEFMLNLIQKDKFKEIATSSNFTQRISNELHADEFARIQEGVTWIALWQSASTEDNTPSQVAEVNLPLDLAEALSQLNVAQKEYDMARMAVMEKRSQLFMDWYRYTKMNSGKIEDAERLNNLNEYIRDELKQVLEDSEKVGLLTYKGLSEEGEVVGIFPPNGSSDSLAHRVWQLFEAFREKLAYMPDWKIEASASPHFWTAPDPVITIESFILDCETRNREKSVARDQLSIDKAGGSFSFLPVLPERLPFLDDIQALLYEGIAAGPFGGKEPPPLPSSEPSDGRYDPFIPGQLVWSVGVELLQKKGGKDHYSADAFTRSYRLDSQGQGLIYDSCQAFPTGHKLIYTGSSLIYKKSSDSLTAPLDTFTDEHPDDGDAAEMMERSTAYKERKIVSYTLSGFHENLLLRTFVPSVPVMNLTQSENRDRRTASLREAAVHDGLDNWYEGGFHTRIPISKGPLASAGFAPFRSGFLSVEKIEVIDVFGRRMSLYTSQQGEGALEVIPSRSLSPVASDHAHRGKAYLPPRLLPPSRLLLRWISAGGDGTAGPVWKEFVEMATRPSTSPVCGWLMLNNLENAIVFYNQNGEAIGSLGIEHQQVKYRTRVGNGRNPSDSLEADIGPSGRPVVNAHLASFMWYVYSRSTALPVNSFLSALLDVINVSDQFIVAGHSPSDASLALLMGRPLALVRAMMSLESAGGLLPLSQADMSESDAWAQDLTTKRICYEDRMKHSSANLDHIEIPVRMGDLYDMDNGLIGFLIEEENTPINASTVFYAPAATGGHAADGIVAPCDNTLQLTLGGCPVNLMCVVDPRGELRASTGILPMTGLALSPDQYTHALQNLSMSFSMFPILRQSHAYGLIYPEQPGYHWSWVLPGAQEEVPLDEKGRKEVSWGYSPQSLVDGWLKLFKTRYHDE